MPEAEEKLSGKKPEETGGSGGGAVPFSLTGMPARGDVTPAMLATWAGLYGKTPRNIRRWLDVGEKAGDTCPLNDPAAMPGWWTRNMKWRIPREIHEAAERAAGAAKPAAAEEREVINLADYSLEDGAAVRQARRLVAVAYERLERAYGGQVGNIDALTRAYENAQKTLAKAEADERAAAKARNQMVDRSKIQRDLNSAVQMLAQMRDSMERRVLELLPELAPDLKHRIAAAIREVRSKEDYVFRNLPSMKGPEDVSGLLAA